MNEKIQGHKIKSRLKQGSIMNNFFFSYLTESDGFKASAAHLPPSTIP